MIQGQHREGTDMITLTDEDWLAGLKDTLIPSAATPAIKEEAGKKQKSRQKDAGLFPV